MTNAIAQVRRFRRASLRTAALLTSAALLSGCLGHARPEFEVVGAAVTEQSDAGFVITFEVLGGNRNDDALPLEAVTYSVELDGREVFRGRRMAGATLPRRGEQVFRLPAATPSDLFDPAKLDEEPRFRLAAEIEYVSPGLLAEILFDSDVRRPTARFVSRGVLTSSPPSGENAVDEEQGP